MDDHQKIVTLVEGVGLLAFDLCKICVSIVVLLTRGVQTFVFATGRTRSC